MRVLFVCARNRLRSPTAERVFSSLAGVETESAGIAPDADQPLTAEMVEWAEVIMVMEPKHRTQIARAFGPQLRGKRVIYLNISDDYEYMKPAIDQLL